MPSINQSKKIVASQWGKHPEVVPMFWGKPGMGKSHAALQLGEELGIPKDRTLVVHINNHDVVDFTGVPSVVDGQTIFNPTDMFYKFREGTGAGLIVLEELAQSSHHHQQWAGGFTEERATATFKLDPEVRIIASGNRAEDRAGAKPLLSHLNDRLWHLDIETSLDDWCEWAMDNGVPAIGVAFLRLRPDLLNDFDPSRRSNPTQRSWTKLLTQLPDDLPRDLYLMAAEGKVGEGAAAEWVAARDMMHKVYVTDALRLHVDLSQTKDFIDWAIKNKDIFVGGN
jgi:hypothetical protein